MNKKINAYNLILALILVLELIVIIFFGYQKAGFHEDEYYSYFSSNRSLGLYYPDREWQSSETIKNEFVVLPGERFNYRLISLVQSWDVHPPLFYDILHTACSMFPGVFSKWIGIGVNIIAFILCYVLLYELAKAIGMDKPLRAIVLIAFGFNPMTISGVMFIRMYMWMTVFVIASSLLQVRLIAIIKLRLCDRKLKDDGKYNHKIYRKYLISIALVNFFGFMTQYYYLIFMTMIGFSFCMWMLTIVPRKKVTDGDGNSEEYFEKIGFKIAIKYTAMYVLACGISLMFAVFVYPASLSHIFRGYRGKEAQAAFSDAANILDRFGFFIGLVNEYLLSDLGLLFLILFALAVLGIRIFPKVKKERDRKVVFQIRLLVFTTFCYFFIVAKTALLLGNTSNRYEMPVYPIIILILVYFTRIGARVIVGNRFVKGISLPLAITAIIFSVVCARGLITYKHVLFLYPEEKEYMAFARESLSKGDKLVIAYNDQTPDNIWRLTDEILVFPEAFYVNEANTEEIVGGEFASCESFCAYIADNDNKDAVIENLLYSNLNVTEYEEVYKKDMWTLYRFH